MLQTMLALTTQSVLHNRHLFYGLYRALRTTLARNRQTRGDVAEHNGVGPVPR